MIENLLDEKALFLAALEKATPQERDAFLKEACAGDRELLQKVRRLFKSHDESEGPLDSPPLGTAPTIDQPVTEKPGETIGPYKLLQQIGEGGFGVVFEAEQERPVKRRVALKVIKPGMDTREVIARFEAERQALAMMDHPNIAKVHDAGATENGRPYFVMELVQGVPITEYCDQCNLPTCERLELFVTVCQAVQHAHQKGVIHRDIKPTNVLVAIQDGQPAPKIIDFGVVKAIGQQLTEHTLMTAFAQIVGTPLYMSPEQAELSPLGVDTRSDIYSLGVLLYELLTGSTPLDKERLHAASYDELRRIIREEEPPRPSARISTLAGELANTVAEHRRTDVRRLRQTVRGELDWIVMKCLDKDRGRRYESAGDLARDVERYLNDEPVQACPPSAGYRFRRFASRNRALLASAATVVAALTFGLVLSTWMYLRAASERDRAEAISGFLQWVLASSDSADVEAVVRSGMDIDVEHVQEFESPAEEAEFAISHAWLGNYLATTGKQTEATAVMRKAADHFAHAAKRGLPPAVRLKGLWYLAIGQLKVGDLAGYHEACSTLLHLPIDNDDDQQLRLWICCLGPHPGADLSTQLKQADDMATRHIANNYVGSHSAPWIDLGLLGGLLYRSGNYEQAAQQLEASLAAYPDDALREFRTALDQQLLLAMTKWQQGERDEARRMLAEIQPALNKWLQTPSNTWMRRAEIELLRREAEALINQNQTDAAVEKNAAAIQH